MFDGRFALAVSPEGAVTLPAALRRKMLNIWGIEPLLMCFGVQFCYLCHAEQAESLLRRIDQRICAAFRHDMRQVNAYLHAMERSVTQLEPMPGGRLILPPAQRSLLCVPEGGLLTLLGVDDHMELWNSDDLEAQARQLEQKGSGPRGLLETPICLQSGDDPCSLLKSGVPAPKRCGPCVYLRLP